MEGEWLKDGHVWWCEEPDEESGGALARAEQIECSGKACWHVEVYAGDLTMKLGLCFKSRLDDAKDAAEQIQRTWIHGVSGLRTLRRLAYYRAKGASNE